MTDNEVWEILKEELAKPLPPHADICSDCAKQAGMYRSCFVWDGTCERCGEETVISTYFEK